MDLGDAFVDTNVLIYAHDAEAGEKHRVANELVTGIWENGPYPFISPQVLKELCNVLLRKGYAGTEAWEIAESYLWWKVIPEGSGLIREAAAIQQRFEISVWDSCIVAAAKLAGTTLLLTEDLNHGQDYDGVVVENIFRNVTA